MRPTLPPLLQRVLFAAGLGLTLGCLAGIGEALHLVWTSYGVTLRPLLLLYSLLVDGGAGFLAGLIGGMVWHAVARAQAQFGPRTRGQAGPPSGRESADPLPHVRVTLVWRSLDPQRTLQPAVSRRAALQLGIAAASAGALGLGTLAFSTRSSRPSATAPAYAFAPAASPPAEPVATASNTPIARPPNVLLITLDTLRADQLGAYGHPYVKTPTMDSLAAQGARFNLHMIQEPQTNPSHASMFTGMYPSSSGVRSHMVDKLPSSVDTLSTLFAAAGYTTAGLYSWMSFDPQYCGFDRGFHIYQNVSGQSGGAIDNAVVKQVAAQYRIAEQYLALPKAVSNKSGVQAQMEWSAKGHADITTDSAIAQLRLLASQPFLVWVHYFDPHYPYVPPPPYDNLYDPNYSGKLTFGMDTIEAIEQGSLQPNPDDTKRLMSLYQGEITFMDAQLGRLFSALNDLGLTNSTIVAVTGDHGESFGEHNDLVEAPDFFHPHDLFNTEQRTPLLLRYPGRIRPGTVIQAPTQSIDLFPTLLQLAGLSVPNQSQASSLVPLLDGSDSGATRVAYGAMQDYVFSSVTVPGWKYVRNNMNGSGELFDLNADPGEMRDMSAQQPDVAKQLDARVQNWMKAVGIT